MRSCTRFWRLFGASDVAGGLLQAELVTDVLAIDRTEVFFAARWFAHAQACKQATAGIEFETTRDDFWRMLKHA